MKISKSLLAVAANLVFGVNAVEWHTVSLFTSYFTSFKGNIIVPSGIPSGGSPYLWPGLQPPNNAGVLQPVLDGRNSHWYFGNAFVGTPSEPYGGGVSCSVGQTLGFYMTETSVGSGNWNIGVNNGGTTATYTYNIDLRMNQALFAVELYDVDWNFGSLTFTDVELVAQGTDSSWCSASPQYSNVTLTVDGVAASVANGLTTCTIKSLTLAPP